MITAAVFLIVALIVAAAGYRVGRATTAAPSPRPAPPSTTVRVLDRPPIFDWERDA